MCAAPRRLKMTSKACILRLRRRGAAKRGGRQLGGGQVVDGAENPHRFDGLGRG
jgi:hypothetical protein